MHRSRPHARQLLDDWVDLQHSIHYQPDNRHQNGTEYARAGKKIEESYRHIGLLYALLSVVYTYFCEYYGVGEDRVGRAFCGGEAFARFRLGSNNLHLWMVRHRILQRPMQHNSNRFLPPILLQTA